MAKSDSAPMGRPPKGDEPRDASLGIRISTSLKERVIAFGEEREMTMADAAIHLLECSLEAENSGKK